MKKVILITGASSGMGKETALQLIREGYTVYGAARSINKMQDLISAGGHALEMDITNDSSIQTVVATIIKEQGTIDVLVNNAGFGLYGAVEDVTIDDARYQFEVNLFGLANITQKVLPYMRAKQSGTIINISSMGGKMYTPLGAWYHATKHALEGWSDCLRLELKQFGINVVIIEPGIINTEFGHVLSEPMLKRSKGGAYETLVNKIAKATDDLYAKGKGSPSSLISNLIAKAINTSKPQTRYVAGYMAKPLMWMRKYLGDRIFDTIIMSQAK